VNYQEDIALERLAITKGIELTKKGKKLVALCPFGAHEGQQTLVIDPKKNTWECEAGCGSGGVIEFVAKAEGVSAKHAVELLKAEFEPDAETPTVKHSTTEKLDRLVDTDEPDDVVLHRVLGFYRQTLQETPKALDYLRDRGLRDPELINKLGIGFADRTLGYRLPRRNRKAGDAIRSQLRRIGILRDTGHELFRGSIIVPLHDLAGRVVQVYGRKINHRLREGTQYHVTLTDEDVGVFNPQGFVPRQKVIVTYSVIDALTWWAAGFRNVTTTLRKATLPRDVKALLADKSIKGVAVAFPKGVDPEVVSDELRELGIEVTQITLPKDMDANDIARQGEDPREALAALLRTAQWVSGAGPRTATEAPPEAAPEPTATHAPEPEKDHQVTFAYGDRKWRIRGLENNTSHGTLKVNILVARSEAAGFHVDQVSLYAARHRRAFLKAAAEEIDVDEKILKKDLGKVLLELEDIQDNAIRQALEPGGNKTPEMDAHERDRALAYLRDPQLLDRIQADFEALGVVGEHSNKMVGYLAATSRKLKSPLAVVIQSSSAAGKSSLMEAVIKFIPDEDKLSFSAMTGRSLFYLGQEDLAHKVLSIAEEEGASDASYALKILQSEGCLTIASTGKESKTGRLTTQTYRVSGPVALILTTTAIDVDEELLSRCVVLAVDEGREQTRAIHEAQRQRKTLDGLMQATRHDALVALHHDAQRLLRPLHVVIPMAGELTYADHALRTRRDHQKFLALIQAVTLLHQHQRTTKEADLAGVRIRYIEATDEDVKVATALAHEVLGQTLDDLPPGTRKLLVDLHGYVTEQADAQGVEPCDFRFTRRQAREHLNVGNTQMKIHMRRLLDLEFLVVHRGGEGRRIAYELVYQGEGQDGGRFLPGLVLDGTTPSGRGSEVEGSGSGRPKVGPMSVGGRGAETEAKSNASNENPANKAEDPQGRSIGPLESGGHRSRTDGGEHAPQR